MSESISIEDRWVLIETMAKELGLVRQHLDSYNEFITNGLQNVVKEIGMIKPEIHNYFVRINKIDMESHFPHHQCVWGSSPDIMEQYR
jgi:DNA-directed RNA polymerase subunit B